MTLQNLLAIQRLLAFEPSRDDVQRLLAAAERNLADLAVDAIGHAKARVGTLDMAKKSANVDINTRHVDAVDISLGSCRQKAKYSP